jgi:hypothetical protein
MYPSTWCDLSPVLNRNRPEWVSPWQHRVTTAAPIPEEARKHFVIGTTLFKDAKTADDFSQVVSEFKKAADLAPQWPEARYNLALAKEAAGDYSGAMADLKIYQQFKLSDSEARAVQDKIYALEAKAEVAAKKQAADQQAVAAQEEKKRDYHDKIGFLEGTWNCTNTILCECGLNGRTFHNQVVITITGKTVLIAYQTTGRQMLKGVKEGDDYTSIKWILQGDSSSPDSNQRLLPDYPISVTIDKNGHQIYWKEPGPLMGNPPTWDFQTSNNMKLTQ